MIVPLISIHYVEQLGWATASIGIVLGMRQLFQQGFTVVGGMLADRFGARLLILCGLVVRVIGFGAMACHHFSAIARECDFCSTRWRHV
jgi:DHA1 family multidrug resistance protein-like MFS transporter